MTTTRLLIIGAIVCCILCPIMCCFNTDAAWCAGIMGTILLIAAGFSVPG